MTTRTGEEAGRQRGLAPSTRRRQWTVVGLLFAAGCVNYLDRSTLSIANHDIAADLHLSPGQMGALLSMFAWAYAICQMPVGAVTDRLGPRIMLFAGMTAWSAAQVASGAVRTFGTFLAARAALGIGESPLFTAGARAIVDWFAAPKRGLPLGLFNAASSFGPAIAPPILTALMLAVGWRPMFMLMGALGFVVAVASVLIYRDPEKAAVPRRDLEAIRSGDRERTGRAGFRVWARLVRIPTTWAMTGGLFGIVYVTWLYASWLPAYLESSRHIGIAETGWLAAVPQAAGFVGACLGGILSDALGRLGFEPVLSRKIPTVAGLLGAAAFTLASPFAGGTGTALALMSGALFCAFAAGSCSWALGATLVPPDAVATLESVQNVGGSIGGASAPLVTGLIVEHAQSFTLAFVVAAGTAVVSALCYALVRRDAYDRLAKDGTG